MEFGFEVALCSWLETATDWIVARQLGGAVATPGSRIIDICCVVPGKEFDARSRITSQAIPSLAIESDAGAGEAIEARRAFDCSAERAYSIIERAAACGFFEIDRRNGRQYVRQTTRYPDWIGELVGIENKPDLDTPGDLQRQLRIDVSLGLFDRVVLATESYVTDAHLNRLPEAVGVWRFNPETGERRVVREPTPLAVEEDGRRTPSHSAASDGCSVCHASRKSTQASTDRRTRLRQGMAKLHVSELSTHRGNRRRPTPLFVVRPDSQPRSRVWLRL